MILVVYGVEGETHEFMVKQSSAFTASSSNPKSKQGGAYLYVQWTAARDEQFVIGLEISTFTSSVSPPPYERQSTS